MFVLTQTRRCRGGTGTARASASALARTAIDSGNSGFDSAGKTSRPRTWPAGWPPSRGLAARLRRDSEDMRAFALKREAYRSRLVTAEESRAHDDALRRLAGRPALTQPWAGQESARVWS
jgi:hypothetical protein